MLASETLFRNKWTQTLTVDTAWCCPVHTQYVPVNPPNCSLIIQPHHSPARLLLKDFFFYMYKGFSCAHKRPQATGVPLTCTSTTFPICVKLTPTSWLSLVKDSARSLWLSLFSRESLVHSFFFFFYWKNNILTWQGLARISLVFTTAQTSRLNARSIQSEIGFANLMP